MKILFKTLIGLIFATLIFLAGSIIYDVIIAAIFFVLSPLGIFNFVFDGRVLSVITNFFALLTSIVGLIWYCKNHAVILGASFLLLIGLSPQVGAYNEDDLKVLLETKVCDGCDLSGANLVGVDLKFVSLVEANLVGANLTGSNLTGAQLPWAIMSQADLTRTNLTRSNLSKANLIGANLKGAILTETNLTRSSLEDAENFYTAHTAGTIFCRTIMPDGQNNKSGC